MREQNQPKLQKIENENAVDLDSNVKNINKLSSHLELQTIKKDNKIYLNSVSKNEKSSEDKDVVVNKLNDQHKNTHLITNFEKTHVTNFSASFLDVFKIMTFQIFWCSNNAKQTLKSYKLLKDTFSDKFDIESILKEKKKLDLIINSVNS